MKSHRVERKLPVGVSPSVVVDLDPLENFMDAFPRHVTAAASSARTFSKRVASNAKPATFTLDVPESAVVETAAVLRSMADELEGR